MKALIYVLAIVLIIPSMSFSGDIQDFLKDETHMVKFAKIRLDEEGRHIVCVTIIFKDEETLDLFIDFVEKHNNKYEKGPDSEYYTIKSINEYTAELGVYALQADLHNSNTHKVDVSSIERYFTQLNIETKFFKDVRV